MERTLSAVEQAALDFAVVAINNRNHQNAVAELVAIAHRLPTHEANQAFTAAMISLGDIVYRCQGPVKDE